MKSVVVALLILAVIIGGSIIFTNELDDVSQNLATKNDKLYDLICKEDFEQASDLLSELDDDINKKKLLLASVIDHTEIDKMVLNIAQAKAYVGERKKEDSLSFVNALSSMFSHIPKNYHVKIENIL